MLVQVLSLRPDWNKKGEAGHEMDDEQKEFVVLNFGACSFA